MRIGLLGVIIGLLVASGAAALHGAWQDHYVSATGDRCCGPRDCQSLSLRVISMDATHVTLELAARWTVVLPRASFHLSEDRQDWWCALNPAMPPSTGNTRCVFLAVGT